MPHLALIRAAMASPPRHLNHQAAQPQIDDDNLDDSSSMESSDSDSDEHTMSGNDHPDVTSESEDEYAYHSSDSVSTMDEDDKDDDPSPPCSTLRPEYEEQLRSLHQECETQKQTLQDRFPVPAGLAARYADLPERTSTMPVAIQNPQGPHCPITEVYFHWSPGTLGYGYWELRHPDWDPTLPDYKQTFPCLRLYPDATHVLDEPKLGTHGHHHARHMTSALDRRIIQADEVAQRFSIITQAYYRRWWVIRSNPPSHAASIILASRRDQTLSSSLPRPTVQQRRRRIQQLYFQFAWHVGKARIDQEEQQQQQQGSSTGASRRPALTFRQKRRNMQIRGIAHEIEMERRRLEHDRGNLIDTQRQEEMRIHTQRQRGRARESS